MAPADPRVETLRLLNSIDTTLRALLIVMRGGAAAASTASVASDADMDSQYGNPEVRAKDPRDWSGAPMKGRKFSECPAEYLDLLASRFDYFAENEDDPKKKGYCRKDAARARGWAKRVREGRVPEAETVTAGGGSSIFDDGGFEEVVDAPAAPADWGY